MEWDLPEYDTGPILRYIVKWTNTLSNIADEGQTEGTVYFLQDLKPFVNYSIQVQAETDAGRGNWTDPVVIQTKVGVPYPPRNVRELNKTGSSIEVEWDSPEYDVGPILQYIIRWTNVMKDITSISETENTFFLIQDLKPFTNYSIQVQSETITGRGNWSEPIAIQTKSGVPFQPRDLDERNSSDTSIEVEWNSPEYDVGPILHYNVRWRNMNSNYTGVGKTRKMFFPIKSLDPYTNYSIAVQAETDAGKGNWSKSILVQTKAGVPAIPASVTTLSSNTSIQLFWSKPKPFRGPILDYIIVWRSTKPNSGGKDHTKDNRFLIENLTPYTTFFIQISAVTEAGEGPKTAEIKINTTVGIPNMPRSLRKKNITDTSIEVEWDSPEPDVGPIIKYLVVLTNIGNNKTRDIEVKDSVILIQDLKPFTNYSIQVQARTKAGQGQWSEPYTVRTAIGVPSAPRNLKIQKLTNTSINLDWEDPLPVVGPIQEFLLTWQNLNSSIKQVVKIAENHHRLENLEPYTNYSIKVLAKTKAGVGEPTKPIIVRTLSGVPVAPQGLIQVEATNRSIEIKWQEPKPYKGPIRSYSVKWGSQQADTKDLKILIVGLNPFTMYQISVQARTDAGFGNWSAILEVKTKIGVPTSPRNLSVDEINATSLRLTWSQPDPMNGPLHFYRVFWGAKEDTGRKNIKMLKDNYLDVLSLLPYTEYVFQVTASTEAGWGKSSHWFTSRTSIAVPTAPNILSLKLENSSVLMVDWIATVPYPGPTSYELYTRKWPGVCEGGGHVQKVMEGNRSREEWSVPTQVLLDQLIPYARYSVHIVLKTVAGTNTSDESSPILMPPQAPGPPTNVRANCEDESTEAEVSWSMPYKPNAKIIHYIVEYGTEYLGYRELTVKVNDVCQVQRIKIRGLRPERDYRILVRAIGEGVSAEGKRAPLEKACTLPAGVPPVGNTQHIQVKGSDPYHLLLKWNDAVFSDVMGALIQYSVIVGLPEAIGKATLGKIPDDIPPWKNFSTGASGFYQATPFGWNPFHKSDEDENDPLNCKILLEEMQHATLECTLGLEIDCPANKSECNGPLKPDTLYGVKLRAFTRGGYSETAPIFTKTAQIPRSNLTGALVGSLFCFIVLGSSLFGFFIIRKKGGFANIRKIIESRFMQSPVVPQSNPAVELETYENSRCLNIHNFCDHVQHMLSDSHLRFSEEFENLKLNSPKFSCHAAEMEENRHKNRWMNIFPYDHSRVKLLPLGDELASDFINANYIVGDSSQREYIASQGPLPNTVDDFWRMMWEQSSTMIVMLTQLIERGKVKCEQYWPPPGEAKYYGDIQVQTISESMLSSYTIRVFQLQLGSQQRKVKQMHFTRWPDFGCPESPEDLINFVRAVREHLPRIKPGPIVVHCSAGVGRTGTFIAVDRLAQQLKHTDCINVFDTVMELRHHRINMVQTEDQYIYIHLCVKQLVLEILQPSSQDYDEAIYSNLAMEKY